MANELARRIEKFTEIDLPTDLQELLQGEDYNYQLLKKGLEEHPMNAESDAIKGWISRLEHDSPRYIFLLDRLLAQGKIQEERMNFVDKFHDPEFMNQVIKIVGKHTKLEVPTRDEINSLAHIMAKLDDHNLYDEHLVDFLTKLKHEVFNYLLDLQKKHPRSRELKDLLTEITRSHQIEHLERYIDEVQYFEMWYSKIFHDDQNWSNFRRFYAERESHAKTLSKRYGDPTYAKMLIKMFEQRHQDKKATEALLKHIIESMKSPKALLESERLGIDQLKRIIGKTLRFYKSQLEDLRTELLKASQRRLKNLERGKGSVLQETQKRLTKERDVMMRIAALSELVIGPSDQSALAEVNTLLSQSGKLEEGLKRLRVHAKKGAISWKTAADMLIRMKEQREDYIAQSKQRIAAYWKSGDVNDQRMDEIIQMRDAIVWYDKEIQAIMDELFFIRGEVAALERYQAIEIKKLARTARKGQYIKPVRQLVA